jgi:DeoR family glycerol-3-phosphate regulon repressor
VTDHTKFARTALVKVCDFEDFDLLITDRCPQEEIAERLRAAETRCEVAG